MADGFNPFMGAQNGAYTGNHTPNQGNQTNWGGGGPQLPTAPPPQQATQQWGQGGGQRWGQGGGQRWGQGGGQQGWQPQPQQYHQDPHTIGQGTSGGLGSILGNGSIPLTPPNMVPRPPETMYPPLEQPTSPNGSGGYGPSANTLQNQANPLALQAGIQGQTPQEKAQYYQSLLGQGYTDAQIRAAAGQQTDSDWSYLQQLAGGNSAPSASMTNDQSMLANAQQQQNASLAAMYAPYNKAPSVTAPTGNTLDYATEAANAAANPGMGGMRQRGQDVSAAGRSRLI